MSSGNPGFLGKALPQPRLQFPAATGLQLGRDYISQWPLGFSQPLTGRSLIPVGGEAGLSGALIVTALTATSTRRSASCACPGAPEKMPKAKSAASGRRRERQEQRRELKRAGGAAWRKLGADRVSRCGLSRGGGGPLWPALLAAPRRVLAQR